MNTTQYQSADELINALEAMDVVICQAIRQGTIVQTIQEHSSELVSRD